MIVSLVSCKIRTKLLDSHFGKKWVKIDESSLESRDTSFGVKVVFESAKQVSKRSTFATCPFCCRKKFLFVHMACQKDRIWPIFQETVLPSEISHSNKMGMSQNFDTWRPVLHLETSTKLVSELKTFALKIRNFKICSQKSDMNIEPTKWRFYIFFMKIGAKQGLTLQ